MHSLMVAPHNGKQVVIVVFHDDALDRLGKNDPAIVEGVFLSKLRLAAQNDTVYLPFTDFMFCYEPDQAVFEEKCRELGNVKAILQWLGRGWENRPAERDTMIKLTSISPKD